MTGTTPRGGGQLTGLASIAAAIAVTALIIVPSENPRLAATLTVFGVIALVLGLLLGSGHVVALASAPVLGAAVVQIQVADESIALWALGVGCGWYLAVELAWESIARRRACRYHPGVARNRTQELVSVIATACLLSAAALAASGAAPRRTLLLEAAVIVAVLGGGAFAVRRLTRGASDPTAQ